MRVRRMSVVAIACAVLSGCPEEQLSKVPGDLKGQFCDPAPESGAGLGRVEVQLFYLGGEEPVEGKSAVGDAQGQFEILQIPPGDYTVVGTLGLITRSIDIVIEPELVTTFKDPGCHEPPPPPPPTGGIVRGRACDDDLGQWVGFGTVWLSPPGDPLGVAAQGLTDLEGNYEIVNVPPGTYDLHIEKGAYFLDVPGVVVTEGMTTDVPSPATCDPPPAGSVVGQVCEQGRGWLADGRAYINLLGGSVLEDMTDAEGRFEILNVPPGDHVVRVEKDLFARSFQVTVPSGGSVTVPGPATCEVPMGAGTVNGRVCAPDGETWLAGATVYVGDPSNPTTQTTTDATGNYTLTGVPEGEQTITVVKNSFMATYTVTVPANGNVTIPEDQCQVTPTVTRVAVLTGLYDNVRCVLTGQNDPQASLAGHQCTIPGLGLDPAQVTSIDGRNAQYGASLLGNYAAMQEYDIIFFNCGIDDSPVTSSAQRSVYAANLRQFVEQGGSIYASDWAAAIVEQAFPEFVGWQGGSGMVEDIDNAKVGKEQNINGNVVDPGIRAALGQNSVALNFDLPGWVSMRSTALATRVYIRGNATICADAFCFNETTASNIPLTVGFDVGQGRVVFTSFHQEHNITEDMLQVLNLLVFEL